MVVSENATWDLEMKKKTSALVDGCTVPGHSISHVSSRLLKSDFSISTDANRTGKRRGVVHSQRGCADFKSLKKILCFIELFQIFRIFFRIFFGCTRILWLKKFGDCSLPNKEYGFLILKTILGIFGIFFGFSDLFWGCARIFFWVNNPSERDKKWSSFS